MTVLSTKLAWTTSQISVQHHEWCACPLEWGCQVAKRPPLHLVPVTQETRLRWWQTFNKGPVAVATGGNGTNGCDNMTVRQRWDGGLLQKWWRRWWSALNQTWIEEQRPGQGRSRWSASSRAWRSCRSCGQRCSATWGCTFCRTPSSRRRRCPSRYCTSPSPASRSRLRPAACPPSCQHSWLRPSSQTSCRRGWFNCNKNHETSQTHTQ